MFVSYRLSRFLLDRALVFATRLGVSHPKISPATEGSKQQDYNSITQFPTSTRLSSNTLLPPRQRASRETFCIFPGQLPGLEGQSPVITRGYMTSIWFLTVGLIKVCVILHFCLNFIKFRNMQLYILAINLSIVFNIHIALY